MSETAAFEVALQANPDDLAGWYAYADYLVEHGDPRGEFMQVQLALEDETRSKEERDQLRAREAELLAAHRADWLGPLATIVPSGLVSFDDFLTVSFTRGWLTAVRVEFLTAAQARALAAPELRLLRRLEVISPDYHDQGGALQALADAPLLANLRAFSLGGAAELPPADNLGSGYADGSFALDLVGRMPRLEELHLAVASDSAPAVELFGLPMPRLRVLRYAHAHEHPFHALTANPTLGNLNTLHCHPHAADGLHANIRWGQLSALCRATNLPSLAHLHLRLTDFGDAGAEEIVASGALRRFRSLVFRYGSITDAGAEVLAASPDLKNLELLDLTMNAMTAAGIATLAATGINLLAGEQHNQPFGTPDQAADYLYYGDCE